jgi:predicted amidohydrolase
MASKYEINVALAQIAPVWLQRDATIAKVSEWIGKAGQDGADLVVFGEALIPGYPFWVEITDGPLRCRQEARHCRVCRRDGTSRKSRGPQRLCLDGLH